MAQLITVREILGKITYLLQQLSEYVSDTKILKQELEAKCNEFDFEIRSILSKLVQYDEKAIEQAKNFEDKVKEEIHKILSAEKKIPDIEIQYFLKMRFASARDLVNSTNEKLYIYGAKEINLFSIDDYLNRIFIDIRENNEKIIQYNLNELNNEFEKILYDEREDVSIIFTNMFLTKLSGLINNLNNGDDLARKRATYVYIQNILMELQDKFLKLKTGN